MMDDPVAVHRRQVPPPSSTGGERASGAASFRKRIRRADLFPKPKEDFQRQQSQSGAMVSVVAASLISVLVLWEFAAYIYGRDAYSSELVVIDEAPRSWRGTARVPVNIDITFPAIQCHKLWLDVVDISDGFDVDAVQDLVKSPVSSRGRHSFSQRYNLVERQHALAGILETKRFYPIENEFDEQLRAHEDSERPGGGGSGMHGQIIGNMIVYIPQQDIQHKDYCGHCYVDRHLSVAVAQGATAKSEKCCNTCSSVMDAFDQIHLGRPDPASVEQCLYEESKRNPGCNIRGTFLVKRVKGNFHFRAGIGANGVFGEHFHNYDMSEAMQFNVSHDIHHLSFGDADVRRFTSTRSSESGLKSFPLDGASIRTRHALESVIYNLNIVPATYTSGVWGSTGSGFEFSAQHQRHSENRQSQIRGMGLTFQFDFYNMQLNNRFRRPAFGHFLVQLCGIVGGLFVVTSFVDRAVDYYEGIRKSVGAL